MGKRIRSMRGEIIDMDLLKIKQQMASAPKPVDVKEREQFVDKKIRRRVRKQKTVATEDLDIDANIKATIEPEVEVEVVQEPTTKVRPVRKKGE